MINAIIMASGLSRRMGENKLLLKYNNKTIIENVLDEITKVNFNEIILITSYKEIINICKNYNIKVIYNEKNDLGQSESIKLGVNESNTDGYMFFVGDQPLIKSEDINKLINAFNEDREYIIIPKYKEKTGNPVIFPKNKKEQLLSLKEDEKGKKVIKSSEKIKYISVNETSLFDIDTKEDYYKLLNL